MLDYIEIVEDFGQDETYDLEVDHPDHTFYGNNISVSNSHAAAYAALAYQCAYLQTYYQDEWIASCLDHSSTEKGKAAGKEDPKAITIRDAQSLGYKMGACDINKSGKKFAVSNKKIIPSFSSMKYVGESVVEEIERFRPYKTALDLILNPDKTWKHSKFNKRALSTLIQLGAFDSMDLVGPGKQFNHYRQMHMVLIDGYDILKKTSARKKNNDVEAAFNSLIENTKDEPDWTPQEKTIMTYALAGSFDTSLVVTPDLRKVLEDKKIKSIDDYDEEGTYWGIIAESIPAVTKTGKAYVKLKLFADLNTQYTCFLWNYKGSAEDFSKYDVIIGICKKDDYGVTVRANSIYKVNTP